MKISVFPLLIIFASWVTLWAQPPIAEWEKIASIKLLESNRDYITKLLTSESLESGTTSHVQTFFTYNSVIGIHYSNGTCEGDLEEWNVPEWVVTKIVITPKDKIELPHIGIDYSKFRKERTDWQRKQIYVLHDKPSGIALFMFGSWVETVSLFPSAKHHSQLCDKDEVKEYYASKRWRRDPKFRKYILDYNHPADVEDLVVSSDESAAQRLSVVTTAKDPDYDILTFIYKVTAGKIVGVGARVIWDLSGVPPGTYSITAAADDGCGPCGKFVTRTIVVK